MKYIQGHMRLPGDQNYSRRESQPPQNGYILNSNWKAHTFQSQSYTNIAVFAGSVEVESGWIYIYYVMGGCSRVTLAHMKSPYSRNKQLVHLGGRLFGAQRITDQCDSSVIRFRIFFFVHTHRTIQPKTRYIQLLPMLSSHIFIFKYYLCILEICALRSLDSEHTRAAKLIIT